MIYQNKKDWIKSPNKRVSLLGMSGLGKTRLSNMLQSTFNWFHYSVDYRIGTRYLDEFIVDNFKQEAMKNDFLRELLLSDSIYISSNLNFNNLSPLSTYLGKPGKETLGGINFEKYKERQKQHREAEILSILDTNKFIKKSNDIYGYQNFVCDTSGSICEVVNPEDPNDPLLSHLYEDTLIILIKGSRKHKEQLIKRFKKDPKPIYYNEDFLNKKWSNFKDEFKVSNSNVDPDKFILYCFEELLDYRTPIYNSIAKNWGITIDADDISKVKNENDFINLVSHYLSKIKE
ncbi:MAG: ATPase [Rhodobacterales bacterium]|nr:MAG: ATPase [Rhodobacterales bacterium]